MNYSQAMLDLTHADWQKRLAAVKMLAENKDPAAVASFINTLSDSHPDVRRTAALALGEMKAPQAVPSLIKALKDFDPGVRQAAVLALGQKRAPRSLAPLLQILGDGNWWVRKTLAWAVREIIAAPGALPFMSQILNDQEIDVPEDLARIMREKIEGPEVLGHLLDGLRDDDPEVRRTIAGVLGERKDPRAIEPLILALEDADPAVRRAAAHSLGQIKDKEAIDYLIQALNDENPDVCKTAGKALAALGLPWGNWFMQATLEGNGQSRTRLVFKVQDHRLTPLLLQAMKSKEWRVRQGAALTLSEMKASWAVPPLIEALSDKEAEVIHAAIIALGNLKESEAVAPLIQILNNAPSNLRRAAAQALGEIKDPRAVGPLLEALQDMAAEVRQDAIRALGKIEAPGTIAGLIQTLVDDDFQVRRAAAVTLGALKVSWASLLVQAIEGDAPAISRLSQVQDPRLLALLLQCLEARKWQTRHSAVRILGERQDSSIIDPLVKTLSDEIWQVREAAASALGKIEDPGVTTLLIGILSDKQPEVVRAAALALGEIKTLKALGPLINLLEKPDPDLRKTAMDALIETLKSPEALNEFLQGLFTRPPVLRQTMAEIAAAAGINWGPLLLKALFGDREVWGRVKVVKDHRFLTCLTEALEANERQVRQNAAKLLGEIEDPQAINPLIESLGDSAPQVRVAVALALGQLKEPRGVGYLIDALSDADTTVSLAAANALETLEVPWSHALRYALLGTHQEESVAHLREVTDPRILPPLMRALKVALSSKDYPIRRSAARVLGEVKCSEAVESLLVCLNDRDKGVRDLAARALGQIGDPQAVEPLLKKLSADESIAIVDFEAMKALGEIGDPRAGRMLEKIVTVAGANREVMQIAREALDKIALQGAELLRLNQDPVCARCWCRFAEFQVRLTLWRRYRLFGCRRCQAGGPWLEGVQRLVLVLDRRLAATQEATTYEDETLYIHWLPHKRAADLDELLVGQIGPQEIGAFLIDWAERADEWQRSRLKSVPVTLLPEAQLELNDQRLLDDRFAGVRRLPEMEAGELRKSLGLFNTATTPS